MPNHRLKTKRAYDPPSQADGARILVDRVWPRGVSKEDLNADLWLKEAAPSTELRRWFGHDRERWHEFRRRYFNELDEAAEAVDAIRRRLRRQDVTLLFSARDTEHNQAEALRDYLMGRSP